MMKGDAYNLPISIETADGTATQETFEEIEVSIGNSIRKTLSSGEIGFDSERNLFLIPLTQEETFALKGRAKVNVRCKYIGGNVIGADLGILEFSPSLSKEVI